jgi:hypothetical protein
MAYRFFKACSKFFNLKQFGDGESKIQACVVNARIKYFAKKIAVRSASSNHYAFSAVFTVAHASGPPRRARTLALL